MDKIVLITFLLATFSSSMHSQEDQYHEYIILGAGISGLQAGIILSQFDKDFIILEATHTVGGRIGTETLGQVIIKQALNPNNNFQNFSPSWINQDPDVLQVPIEYGATWIATAHEYMKKLCKQLNITIFPQYKTGYVLYGVQPGTYVTSQNLYPEQTRQVIGSLLSKIEKLTQKFSTLYEQVVEKEQKNKKQQYKQFIDKYDTISVKQFIESEVKNNTLADQLMGFIECLQCIDCGKFSMMQMINDADSLSNVYYMIEDPSENNKDDESDDGFRVKTGSISIINKMVEQLLQYTEMKLEQIIKFNSPVYRVQLRTQKNKNVRIYTKTHNGIKIYQCKKVLNAIPLATMSKIQIVGLSKAKQLIFTGQQMGIVYRVYMVFSQPFWRNKFSGYGLFSSSFPFNEMTDISPEDNSCGVLAFVFYAERYQKWQQAVPSPLQQFNFIKKVIADMFLKGDTNSQYLKECLTYTRTFTFSQYIKAAYQPTTKIGVWKAVQDIGDEFTDSFERDENGMLFIGSQFDEQFGSYMQGSIRLTRKKVYQLISKPDPWVN